MRDADLGGRGGPTMCSSSSSQIVNVELTGLFCLHRLLLLRLDLLFLDLEAPVVFVHFLHMKRKA